MADHLPSPSSSSTHGTTRLWADRLRHKPGDSWTWHKKTHCSNCGEIYTEYDFCELCLTCESCSRKRGSDLMFACEDCSFTGCEECLDANSFLGFECRCEMCAGAPLFLCEECLVLPFGGKTARSNLDLSIVCLLRILQTRFRPSQLEKYISKFPKIPVEFRCAHYEKYWDTWIEQLEAGQYPTLESPPDATSAQTRCNLCLLNSMVYGFPADQIRHGVSLFVEHRRMMSGVHAELLDKCHPSV